MGSLSLAVGFKIAIATALASSVLDCQVYCVSIIIRILVDFNLVVAKTDHWPNLLIPTSYTVLGTDVSDQLGAYYEYYYYVLSNEYG